MGIGAVALDLIDVRTALKMPRLRDAARDYVESPFRRLVEALAPLWPFTHGSQKQTIDISGTVSAHGDASATVTRLRTPGETTDETVARLWQIVTGEHDPELADLRSALSDESVKREDAIGKTSAELRASISEAKELVGQVLGTHHGRRLFFAFMIVVGVALSAASVWTRG